MNITHIIDLTHPITSQMPHHPYDDPATINQTRLLHTHHYNDHQLTTGMHVGTHIDGPAHLLNNPLTIAQFPARYFIGQGVLIDARDKKIDASLLKNIALKPDSIVLVLTGHNKKFGTTSYFSDYPILHHDFAQELIKHKINLLGIDTPSPDIHPFEVHKMLLQRNILIIENLTNIEGLVGIPQFTIAALPLNIEANAAPARVVAFY